MTTTQGISENFTNVKKRLWFFLWNFRTL